MVPTFTTSRPGPEFSGAQLAFAAVASIALYGLFVFVQTVRHRDYFLPAGTEADDAEAHAAPPSSSTALFALGFLCISLVAVVGLAKIESPAIEDAVDAIGAPPSAVGVVIALLVLLPETLAAVRNALHDRMQTSFNLALGSAMASIGLTIPAIAVASIWLDGPLVLGLGSTQTVLLAITVVVTALTVLPGRATLQEGGVHLVLFASFLFLAVNPVATGIRARRPAGGRARRARSASESAAAARAASPPGPRRAAAARAPRDRSSARGRRSATRTDRRRCRAARAAPRRAHAGGVRSSSCPHPP